MCVVCGCSDNSPAHARHIQTHAGEAGVVQVNPGNGDLHFGAGAARVSVLQDGRHVRHSTWE
jgi:hydrogenase nickel incorporation protein HypB